MIKLRHSQALTSHFASFWSIVHCTISLLDSTSKQIIHKYSVYVFFKQVPVASTVIPLEDLPTFEVGLGFGLSQKESKPKKPANLKDIQLVSQFHAILQIIDFSVTNLKFLFQITAKNQHRFVAPAGVQELTKEQFEQFNLSKK